MLAVMATVMGMSSAALAAASSNAQRSTENYEPIGDSLAYTKRPGPGHSVAHVKRMKRKKRNRLRAKGQHRKAVR